MTKIFVAFMVLLAVSPPRCSSGNAVSALNAVVASAEAVLPLVANLSPADQAKTATYLDSVLAITQDVIDGGTTADRLAAAVGDFARLDVPVLSQNASPKTVAVLNGVVKSVQAFLRAYQGTPSVPVLKPSETQAAHKIRSRAAEARVRLGGGQ